MNRLAERIYYSSPIWAQQLLVSAYGVKLWYLRTGRARRAKLDELLRTQWLPGDRLLEMQLRTLADVVAHARATVPLYQERDLPSGRLASLDDLTAIPLLHKDDLRRPVNDVTSALCRRRHLATVHTGGTTGKPLTIYCDRGTLQRNYAFFDRLRVWARVPEGARVATFAGRTIVPPEQRQPPFWRRHRVGNATLFSSYHISPDTVGTYVDALADLKPELIDSYPSSIGAIARHVRDRGDSRIRPRAVITSSETLMPEVRRLIEEAFACRVFDHYGAAEMAALVTQCEAGTYHVNPEFGVLELLRDGKPAGPGEAGEIVATGFLNPVMPLIRYATGDVAVRGNDACTCGRAFPTLERIEGRRDDVLVTPEGRWIGRLDPIFKAVASIHETQITQDAPDHVTVAVVLRGALADVEEQTLRRELRNRLGPAMRIDIVVVPSIPRTPAGKFRAVVNLMGTPGLG